MDFFGIFLMRTSIQTNFLYLDANCISAQKCYSALIGINSNLMEQCQVNECIERTITFHPSNSKVSLTRFAEYFFQDFYVEKRLLMQPVRFTLNY